MVAVFIIGIMVYLYLRVRRVTRMFAGGGRNVYGANANGTNADGSGRQSAGASAHQGGTSAGDNGRTSSACANEELYDERSPREANRKIFSKDEGEYVDFEEV